MNAAVIFLAIICIWPADNTQSPKLVNATFHSLDACKAAVVVVKTKLDVDPAVRYVNAACIEFDQGNKA